MYIEYTKGKRNWHLVAANGNILLTSGTYYSTWNCKRSAKIWARRNNIELRLA